MPASPVGFYLLFAGLGHAYGIAAVNPWLALRYMAISKLLVCLALLKFSYDIWNKKYRKK
jgi:hypothetical protein